MKRKILALLVILSLLLTCFAFAEEAQPEAKKCGAPASMGDYLHRYPDQEITNADGSVTEIYNGISLDEHNAFLAFLTSQSGKQKARVFASDANYVYQTENGQEKYALDHYELDGQTPVHYVVIIFNDKQLTIYFRYDTATEEARVIYPQNAYDTRTATAKEQYGIMVSQAESGHIAEAVQAYRKIPEAWTYQPAVDYVAAHNDLATAINQNRFQIKGEYVSFGRYEQNGSSADGAEPIEWLVLDVQDGRSLLVSRYALDTVPYNASYEQVTWESSSIRAWLNGDFTAAAFSESELSAILETEVDNGPAQGSSDFTTRGGSNTQDRIFLLSYGEAAKYFTDDESRKCTPTAFAAGRGAWTSPDDAACGWWLRSPGSLATCAIRISSDGSARSAFVDYDEPAVRPAFWINLNSDYFNVD